MQFGDYKWTLFMRSAQRSTTTNTRTALIDPDKPWSRMKKISVFGPAVTLVFTIITKAVFGSLIWDMVPTLAIILFTLNLFRLWSYIFIWGAEDAKKDGMRDPAWVFLFVVSTGCAIGTVFTIYFSHNLAAYLVAVVRSFIVSTPKVTEVVVSGLWGLMAQAWHSLVFFVTNFYQHALYGESP